MNVEAVVALAYGGPEVLSVIETELDEPKAGDVVVDVRAAGTNPIDHKLYSGTFGDDPAKLPMRLGFEAAGVVRSVGSEVSGPTGPIRPGDEVIVYRGSGTYASAIASTAGSVLAKPASMTFEEASGLMLTGVTAVHALRTAGVSPGDTVVVHGAAGGVGLMVVQIAAADGARVIGTASEPQHEFLRSLGVEPVAYGPGLAERIRALAPDGVDAALDLIGSDEAGDVSVELVQDRGRIVTIAGFARAPSLEIKAIGSGPGADPGTELRDAARLELIHRVNEGKLRVFVDASYSFSDATAAHQRLASGHAHGKIVLIP